MAGTFTQIYIHIVFSVKGRRRLLQKPWRFEVFKYMAGIITEKKQKPIIIYGVEDHIHILVGLKPNMCISDLVREIKNNSSKFINQQNFVVGKFAWQEGYGAFSCGHTSIKNVYDYIAGQEEHHRNKTFQEEYLNLLKEHNIDFDEKYLF
ncbi:MAG: IS200/IS605 family transposase [Bacteroidetes bacterium]|nr:IS200/IS605 family transposase [Bacteroidota bacterium]